MSATFLNVVTTGNEWLLTLNLKKKKEPSALATA